MSKYSWKQAIKDTPEYIKNGLIYMFSLPLWMWVTQIIYLVTLFGGLYLSVDAMITWMDSLGVEGVKYEYDPLHELIFWGWMFGTITGMFLYRSAFSWAAGHVLSSMGYRHIK